MNLHSNIYQIYIIFMMYIEQSAWMLVDDRRGLPGTKLIRPRP